MLNIPRLPLTTLTVAIASAACIPHTGTPILERQTEQTFAVAPGSVVKVSVSGGPIRVTTGAPGRVEVVLLEEVFARSETEAREVLDTSSPTLEQNGDEVVVDARRPRTGMTGLWGPSRIRFTATLTVPPDVRLDADTSGGSIAVRGERSVDTSANTSGGSISVDGGGGEIRVETSGGSVTVGRVLDLLRARTSGGSITVGYVGPDARDIDVSTSGGGIRVGIDPAASVALEAGTSGGSVSVSDLRLETSSRSRTQIRGTLNGGRGRVTAHTSGGGVSIRAARSTS